MTKALVWLKTRGATTLVSYYFAKVHPLLALRSPAAGPVCQQRIRLAPAFADFDHTFQTLDDMPSANALALKTY
jgi:hypothetical protein